MSTITCKFCDWSREFAPATRDAAMIVAGRHVERFHREDMDLLDHFDLENLATLPDPRVERRRAVAKNGKVSR